MASFIIIDTRPDGRTFYVCAPKGYYRKADGTLAKDGTPSPEWTRKPEEAHRFKSHRSAALSNCDAEIREINY